MARENSTYSTSIQFSMNAALAKVFWALVLARVTNSKRRLASSSSSSSSFVRVALSFYRVRSFGSHLVFSVSLFLLVSYPPAFTHILVLVLLYVV
jgi:hypothetical protein